MPNTRRNVVGLITRTFFLGQMWVLVLASSVTHAATDHTNREISRTFAQYYFSIKNYPLAREAIIDHLQSDVRDANAWNLLGLTYLYTNDADKAAGALEKAVKIASGDDKGIYLYNYADALNRTGDTKKAKLALNRALAFNRVSDTASDALSSIVAKKPLPPLELDKPGSWKWGAALSSGYDTNVLLYSEDTIGSAGSTDTQSPLISVLVQNGYKTDMGGGEFRLRNSASYTHYTGSEADSFNTIYAGSRLSWVKERGDLSNNEWEFGVNPEITFLNLEQAIDLFSWRVTPMAQMTRQHSATWRTRFTMPAFYQNYNNEADDDPEDDRTGFGLSPAATTVFVLGANALSVGFEYEQVFTNGANFQSSAVSVPVTWTRPLWWKLYGSARFEGARISFFNSDDKRNDTFLRAGYGVSRRLSSNWLLNVDYSFIRNLSSVSTADYTKHSVVLLVSYGNL